MTKNFDVIIVGSGPGGYVCAIRSAQLGFSTAIVERAELGGICLNWGCIPAKALLRCAEVFTNLSHAKDFGLVTKGLDADISAIVKRSRAVAGKLAAGVGFLMKKNKITVLKGVAKLNGTTGKLQVSGENGGEYGAKHIILATGAHPRLLPGLKAASRRIWTYFEALVPDAIPKSLLVVGSGAIGIEFASFYRALGSEVTVVEIAKDILPLEDREISTIARRLLAAKGIKFLTASKVEDIRETKQTVSANVVSVNDGSTQKITSDVLLLAIGVSGNIDDIGLDKVGVNTAGGTIGVDGYNRTNVANIYAIGDVAGAPMLAHKAEHEGVICIEKIAGKEVEPLDSAKIPACTYCLPQIASLGLSEDKAKAEGRNIRVGRFNFAANGKALALGESAGLVKTIFDRDSGELLGAHLIGSEVTELIHGFVVAMNCETTEQELIHTIFPHPTLSEAMHESVLDAYGRALNS